MKDNKLYWQIKAQRLIPKSLFVMYSTPRFKSGYKQRIFDGYKSSKWGVGYIRKLGMRL